MSPAHPAGNKPGRQIPVSALWAIRDDRTLSEHAKLAYIMLWTRGANAHPAVATLAADMGVSPSTARRAIRDLKKHGAISVVARKTAAGDADSNQYEVLPLPGPVTQTGPPGSETGGGAVTETPKDRNHKTQSEGRNTLASRRARPAVTRDEDRIATVQAAVIAAGWPLSELYDEDALDIWDRFISQRRTSVPVADPVRFLSEIFESFVSLDGVLSNTPERDAS